MRLDTSKGMHWIGNTGSLHPFVDYGMESMELDIKVSRETGLGGGERVRVSRDRAPRRWSMTVPDAHADDVKHLRTLEAALMPPYQLVTAHAQVSNVLTPDRSVMRSLLTGTLALAGGWPIADVGGDWTTITGLNPAAAGGAQGLVRIGPAPIPPLWTQRPVTVSVLLATARSAGAYVVLDWLDAAGVQVGAGVIGNSVTGMDGLRRSTVTAKPAWGAVTCRIGVVYAEVIAEPQVTWTAAPIPEWSIGEGADQVYFTALGRGTSMAVPGHYSLRRGDYDVSLEEVLP